MATKEKRCRLDLTNNNNNNNSNNNSNNNPEDNAVVASSSSIFILPHKIQKRRLDILQRNSREKRLPLVDEFSEKVKYVVSELSSKEQTLKALQHFGDGSSLPFVIVKSSWLSRCIKTGTVANIEEEDHVKSEKNSESCEPKKSLDMEQVAEYACQRIATLHHPNETFTLPLEVLEEFADFKDDELNYARALAFRRASAVLKSLKQRVSKIEDVMNLPDVGSHCLQVIREILENGFSTEVESVKENNWYRKMKLFTSVFGVGPATANKWISIGISTIAEAKSHMKMAIKTDPRILFGLTYFDDLNRPVAAAEAERLAQMIRDDVEKIRPGTLVVAAGGFRRGKKYGHDIDLLITHPTDGQEHGVLCELLRRLEGRHLVMFGRREPYSFTDHLALTDSKGSYLRSTLDHFEKWIGVLKIYQSGYTSELCIESKSKPDGLETSCAISTTLNESITSETDHCSLIADCHNKPEQTSVAEDICKPVCNELGPWIARRVDLIVIPQSQFYYGLVGWTGNRHFNRSLRLYAQKELGMKLTSHGLFDKLGNSIPAKNEMEVFQNLKLPYREPFERNC